MKTVIVDVVRKLTPQANESVYQPEASFKFDIDLRNIKDKVVWDPDENGWQVRAKPAKAKAKGKNAPKSEPVIKEPAQQCIKVPNNLEGNEFECARRAAYIQAIKMWNDTDGTKRTKIKVPSDTTLPVRTQAPGKCSNVSGVCLTIEQKWEADAKMV